MNKLSFRTSGSSDESHTAYLMNSTALTTFWKLLSADAARLADVKSSVILTWVPARFGSLSAKVLPVLVLRSKAKIGNPISLSPSFTPILAAASPP